METEAPLTFKIQSKNRHILDSKFKDQCGNLQAAASAIAKSGHSNGETERPINAKTGRGWFQADRSSGAMGKSPIRQGQVPSHFSM
jgi:hypothetical protein